MTLGELIKEYRENHKISMETFSNMTGISKGYISMLEKNKNPRTGKPITPSLAIIKSVAGAMKLDVNSIIQALDNKLAENNDLDALMSIYDNIYPIETQKIPLIGEIACGQPIVANEDWEGYIAAGTNIKADYCLKCKGDSMINARIYDGDIVFIRQQPTVENGEIAAVVIDDEVTLKRVYFYPKENTVMLQAENPSYKPLIYSGSDVDRVKILGKAVAFQGDIK